MSERSEAIKRSGMQASATDEWQTPESILRPVRDYFGGLIDLDPATTPDNPTGAHKFCVEPGTLPARTPGRDGEVSDPRHGVEDGLRFPWGRSRVFLNPPFRAIRDWAPKIGEECLKGCHLILVLPPTRCDTAYFQEWISNERLSAVLEVRGRVNFLLEGREAKNNVYPTLLRLYNGDRRRFTECFAHLGRVIWVERVT